MDYTLSHAAVSLVAILALPAIALKFFTDYIGYIFVVLVFVWALKNIKKYVPVLIQAGTAVLLSLGIITEAIRFLWHRNRPFVEQNFVPLIPHAASSSFPSGHAAFFFAVGTVLYMYNKKAGIMFLAGSTLIGIARVFAGLHWPSDIVGGALIGIASGFLVAKLFSKIKEP